MYVSRYLRLTGDMLPCVDNQGLTGVATTVGGTLHFSLQGIWEIGPSPRRCQGKGSLPSPGQILIVHLSEARLNYRSKNLQCGRIHAVCGTGLSLVDP